MLAGSNCFVKWEMGMQAISCLLVFNRNKNMFNGKSKEKTEETLSRWSTERELEMTLEDEKFAPFSDMLMNDNVLLFPTAGCPVSKWNLTSENETGIN